MKIEVPFFRKLFFSYLFFSAVLAVVLLALPKESGAQVESPTDEFIFLEDSERFLQRESNRRQRLTKPLRKTTQDIDFQAPEVEYDSASEELVGKGGVIIVTPDLIAESDSARYSAEKKTANLQGRVVVSRPEGQLLAEQGVFDLETETGDFDEANFTLDDGNYRVESERTKKLSEFEYHLESSVFTTCSCRDGQNPWEIRCSSADVTDGGFAHTYNTHVRLWDIPVFYTPWMAFPVVRERTSGLLVPQYSYNSQDGVGYWQPVYTVLDEHSDLTLTPFIETKSRYGLMTEYRRAVSRRHSVSARFLYSDESERDGDLRGTITDGLFDPEFDEERFGIVYKHRWSSPSSWDIPLGFVADGNYVSDDLFLRELEEQDFGRRGARFTTSSAAFRAGLLDSTGAEIRAEYNQALQSDDDLVFQRLPELSLDHLSTHRPFGVNPLGIRFSTRARATATRFERDTGYDGWRYDILPSIKMPFRWKNILRNELEVSYRYTGYELDETLDPASIGSEGGEMFLESSNDRFLPTLNLQSSTGLERIYDLDPGNSLTNLLRFGAKNQDYELKRVKHIISPVAGFRLVPNERQSDLPLFDSVDRFGARTLFSYGVRTSLFGSFRRSKELEETIDELAPRPEDLPVLSGTEGVDVYSLQQNQDLGAARGAGRDRRTRELAYLELRQTYDYREDQDDNDPNRRPLSDLAFNFGLFPSQDLALEFESNYGVEGGGFSSWRLGTHFTSDRGDRVRLRYSFVDDSLSQLEGNLELALHDRLGFGYYTRFDEEESEFIENILALRVRSACDCWSFDLGFSDQINPDRERVLFSFTLRGLGDLTQDFGLLDRDGQN